MTTLEEICNVFNMFHDGSISAWTGDKNRLTLTVDCLYLAERVDRIFTFFYVELNEVEKLELMPLTVPNEAPDILKTNYPDIFKASLGILSAEIEEENVVVSCDQDDKAFDYVGGNLTIRCGAIKVFDQNNRELTLAELETICESYWDEWSRK